MKSVILLSGGLDSAVCLGYAVRDGQVVLALTFDYGQLAARREIEAAAALAAHYGVAHQVVALPFLAAITTTSLVTGEGIPEPEVARLDDQEEATARAARVWVPNRNGIFLNIAAAFAEHLGAAAVVAGFNREEAAAFPDNSATFVATATKALRYSTRGRVRVVSYTQQLTKVEIVELGRRLGVPLKLIWSCYRGGETMCGRCESCQRFLRAVAAAKV